jgi:site-specific DNA recombinase
VPVVRGDLADAIAWQECCRLFERLDRIQTVLEAEIERSVHQLLEDSQGTEQVTAMKAAIAYAKREQSKHDEDSYYYNLIAEDIHTKTEQLARYEAEMDNSQTIAATAQLYRQRLMEFLEFVNVMRGDYNSAHFQKKRNAIDVLGLQVRVAALPPEERRPGKEPTIQELRERMDITFSPLFTGVQTPLEVCTPASVALAQPT